MSAKGFVVVVVVVVCCCWLLLLNLCFLNHRQTCHRQAVLWRSKPIIGTAILVFAITFLGTKLPGGLPQGTVKEVKV